MKKGGVKATMMRGGTSLPESLAHNTLPTGLIRDVQCNLGPPERTDPLVPLLEGLDEVRRRFDYEARKDAGEITADEAGVLPRWHKSARIGLPHPESPQ